MKKSIVFGLFLLILTNFISAQTDLEPEPSNIPFIPEQPIVQEN